MEKQQYTAVEEMRSAAAAVKEEQGSMGEAQTIILQMDRGDEEESIDLIHVMEHMGKRWRSFFYLLVIAVCAGFLAAAVITAVVGLIGKESYASAVVTFSFEGIEEGRDPNGGIFDVNKIRSTAVIQQALEELGWEEKNVDAIRANMKLEGVIPDSVKQKIAVINTVSEDAAEYYSNIENLDYFPSQYTVTLYKCKGMNGDETRELLDAVLASYREYFMERYANTEMLGMVAGMLDIGSYDYLQAADVLENEIDTMESYAEARAKEAPDFRANVTGLSFRDLADAIETVRRLDLNNYVSFVQSNSLTKDAGVQLDYYRYQIEQYNLEIQERQSRLQEIERMLKEYQKDPVIVMSSQESVTESSQKNEYYDTLLEKKLELTEEVSGLNSSLNEAYQRVAALNRTDGGNAKEADYAYAQELLSGLIETVKEWTEIVRETAEEYYEREAFAGAYRISIPAQYNGAGGITALIKRMAVCGGVGALCVILLWGFAGLKSELLRMRKAASERKTEKK